MNEIDYKQLWGQVQRYVKLQIDYSLLTLTEKLTLLLSRCVLVLVALLVGTIILFHLSGALVAALVTATGVEWLAYLIVAAILAVCLIVVWANKKRWIVNPVARWLSKLLAKPEKSPEGQA